MLAGSGTSVTLRDEVLEVVVECRSVGIVAQSEQRIHRARSRRRWRERVRAMAPISAR